MFLRSVIYSKDLLKPGPVEIFIQHCAASQTSSFQTSMCGVCSLVGIKVFPILLMFDFIGVRKRSESQFRQVGETDFLSPLTTRVDLL